MIQKYKNYITNRESVLLENWFIPFFDLSKIKNYYWYKPYGDSTNDIYNEKALRSSTLDEETKSKLWTGLVLKNKSGDFKDTAIDNIHYSFNSISDLLKTYKDFKGYWTEVSNKAPCIEKYFKENIDYYLNVGHVYVIKVGPEGFIKEHRDVPDNYDENIHTNFNTLNTFFCPLNDPCHSYFILNGKQVKLQENKVTWFNSSLPHVFFNTSRDDKYFLIFTGLAKRTWINMTISNML